MKCSHDINAGLDYLQGQLSAEQRLGYEQHVADCRSCMSLLREAREARAIWSEVSEDEPGALAWARLDHRIRRAIVEEEAERIPVTTSWWRPAGRLVVWAGAALALAVGLHVGWTDAVDSDRSGETPPILNSYTTALPGEILASGRDESEVEVGGARLMIAAAAACKVTRNDAELTQIDVISGTVTFDVSPRQPGSLFEVRANEVVVRVIGTRFDVSLEPDGAVSVVVEHGVVRVQRGVDPPTTLRAGDALRLVSSESLAVSDSLSPVEEGEDSLPTEVAAEGGETLSEVNKQAPDEPAVLDEQPEETSAAVDPPVGDRTRERARRTASASTRAVRERRRRAAARRQARLEARAASRSTNVAKPVASADTLAQPAPAAESVTSAPSSTNNEVPNAASVSVTREAVEAPEESDSVEVEVAVDAVRESDPAGEELKQIFRQLDGVSYGRSIQDIRRWLENHPRHRHRADARYAIGYCEYKRGNQERAREIFGSLEGSRWIRDIGDIFREPVRPR